MKRALVLLAPAFALAAPAASAARPLIQIHPTEVHFGSQPFESYTKQSLTIQNRSPQALRVTVESFQPSDLREVFRRGDVPLRERLLGVGEEFLAALRRNPQARTPSSSISSRRSPETSNGIRCAGRPSGGAARAAVHHERVETDLSRRPRFGARARALPGRSTRFAENFDLVAYQRPQVRAVALPPSARSRSRT